MGANFQGGNEEAMKDERKILRIEKVLQDLEKKRVMEQAGQLSEIRIETLSSFTPIMYAYFKREGIPRPPLKPHVREIMKGYMPEEEMDGDPDYDPEKDEVRRFFKELETKLEEEEGEGG